VAEVTAVTAAEFRKQCRAAATCYEGRVRRQCDLIAGGNLEGRPEPKELKRRIKTKNWDKEGWSSVSALRQQLEKEPALAAEGTYLAAKAQTWK
jgi:hypothetical protein